MKKKFCFSVYLPGSLLKYAKTKNINSTSNTLGVIYLNMFVFLGKLKIFSPGVLKGTYKNKNK